MGRCTEQHTKYESEQEERTETRGNIPKQENTYNVLGISIERDSQLNKMEGRYMCLRNV